MRFRDDSGPAASSPDASRVEHFARHEADRLYSLFRRTCGDADDAADLLQDTLADALRHLAAYDRDRPFAAWIWRIGQNRLRNWLRRRRLEARVFRPAMPHELAVDDAQTRSRESGEDERRERLEAALGELSDESRAIVLLRYREGRSCREIAEAIGKSPNAVSILLYHARERLRSSVARESAQRGGLS